MEDQEDRNLGVDDLDTIWGHLPEEIVEDILVRLPVKTLLRFKPVSKSWYALISHPQFAKSHIDRANNSNKGHNFNLLRLEKYGLLCFEASPNPSLSLIITDHDDGDRIKLKKQLRNPFLKDQGGEAPGCNDEVQLLGSCDGLLFVCVAASDEIFLWNPSTGETKLISSISEFSSSFHFNFQRISGLGYDDGSNNYKAIIAFRTMSSLVIQPKFGVPEKIAVYVCNSKSGASSIKYYHDFPYSFYRTYIHLGGVTVNGTPHWVVPHIYEDYNHASPNTAIICFDMAEESFKEVSRPDSLTISSHFNVADLGGLLCVVDSVFNGLDVWAMKDYGVKESWTKLFAISTQNDYMNPLRFINIGEVLIRIGNNLVTCNHETGKEFISQRNGSKAVAYVESLVSPNGRGLDGRPC